jgi:hypothetical protein
MAYRNDIWGRCPLNGALQRCGNPVSLFLIVTYSLFISHEQVFVKRTAGMCEAVVSSFVLYI